MTLAGTTVKSALTFSSPSTLASAALVSRASFSALNRSSNVRPGSGSGVAPGLSATLIVGHHALWPSQRVVRNTRVKRMIEFPMEDGTTLVVEVEEPIPEGVVRAARPGEIAERAGQTFEAALEKVKPMAATVVSRLRELAQSPDEIHVEFGIKLSASAGAVLASAGVEGNYKVTVVWRGPQGQG